MVNIIHIRSLINRNYIGLSILLLMLSFGYTSAAQQVDAFAVVKASKTEVFVQEPVRVTITVYTSTWFTDALDYGNFSVANSFVLPFTRTLSSIQYVNKKKYATLTFYYIVFPYSDGTIEIPSLSIKAITPPVGDYKGKEVLLKTKAIALKVKPVPEQVDDTEWMVAKNAYISEKWSKPLSNIKVGDVVERSIYIKAMGTLPSFIPNTHIEELTFASIYPKEAIYKDLKTDSDANGSSVQKILYLFEKEGQFKIPAVQINWWNPYAQKLFSKSTAELSIEVLPNPDLDMLATARDSLNIENTSITHEIEQQWYERLTWKQYLLLAIILVVFYYIIRLLISFIQKIIQYNNDYKHSESFYFKQINRAKSDSETLNAFYYWLFKFKGKYTSRSATNSLDNIELDDIQEKLFSTKKSTFEKHSFISKINTMRGSEKSKPEDFKLNP